MKPSPLPVPRTIRNPLFKDPLKLTVFLFGIALMLIGLIPLAFFGGTFFTLTSLFLGLLLVSWLWSYSDCAISSQTLIITFAGSLTLISILFICPEKIAGTFSVQHVGWRYIPLLITLPICFHLQAKPRLTFSPLYWLVGIFSLLCLIVFFSIQPFLRIWLIIYFGLSAALYWFVFFKISPPTSTANTTSRSDIYTPFIIASGLLFLLHILIQTAWICDDAFITFRTIDNFINGLGLRWNPAERVQTYTHPLYLFILSAVIFFSREFAYTPILVNLILTFAALMVFIRFLTPQPLNTVTALLCLSFSKAFTDFSTSGLENSLSYLFAAIFVIIYVTPPKTINKNLWLGLTAGLAAFNRLDTLLLYLPALFWIIFTQPANTRLKTLYSLTFGFLPLFLWEIFSILYYGFPFPNTAYAKVFIPHVSNIAVFGQGLHYFINSLTLDPITLFIICLTSLTPFLLPRRLITTPLIVGIVFYCFYILKIGGDFMSGRFLALPLFLSIMVLTREYVIRLNFFIGLCAALILISTVLPYNPWKTDKTYGGIISFRGITDERQFYFKATGLLRALPHQYFSNPENHPFTLIQKAGEYAKAHSSVLVHIPMGIVGFSAGPLVHVVDEVGVCDPLLARLPSWNNQFTIGHMLRKLPNGYLESLESKTNRLSNPTLSSLYQQLSLITRAPIFSFERFKTIISFNLHPPSLKSTFFEKSRPHTFLPLDLSDDTYSAKLRTAFSFINASDYLQLEDCLLTAERLDPKRPEAKIYLGILYEYLGKLSMAEEKFKYCYEHSDAYWRHYYPEILEEIQKETKP